jgi:hypothetical protein
MKIGAKIKGNRPLLTKNYTRFEILSKKGLEKVLQILIFIGL